SSLSFARGVKAISAGWEHSVLLYDSVVDFDSTSVGAGVNRTLTITNSGSETLYITSVSVIGDNASDFSVNTSGTLAGLAPTNGQTTFDITFTPSAPGTRTARLRVLNNDNDEN